MKALILKLNWVGLLLLFFRLPATAASDLPDSGMHATDNPVPLTVGTAKALFEKIEEKNNYVEDLTPDDLTQLPVGIKRTVNNIQYIVGITEVKVYPAYAAFTAFLRIKMPQQGTNGIRDLFFGAHGIKLSRSGGIIGDVQLGLLGDFSIDLGGGKAQMILKGAMDAGNNLINDGRPVTYASIDCNGFKELRLSADLIFSRDVLLPLDASGEVMQQGRVKGSFRTVAKDWNDILVAITLPSFSVNGLEDFAFHVNQAVFDFSDLQNDPNTVLPPDYLQQFLPGGEQNLWRGISISNLRIDLPKSIKGKNNNRISIEAKNALIDNMGFTGTASADNLINLSEGKAGTWPLSIDHFSLNILANNLKGASFSGKLQLPVDQKTQLQYEAIISPENEYLLTVKTETDLQFDFVRASKVTLYPNSSVTLLLKDNEFLPHANLNGKMTINASLKKDAAPEDGICKMADIEFRGLELQTVAPKIRIASMGYAGSVSLANFPASIHNIDLAASNHEVRLAFGLDVHLSGEADGGIRGDARLNIVSKLETEEGRDHWKFDRVQLEKVGVHADKGGLELEGKLEVFENDPTYGQGFAGDVSMVLKKLGAGVQVSAKCLFGKTGSYRYWYADALAQIKGSGVPIFPGFKINGLGGGAYEHMVVKSRTATGATGIGVTPSGLVYEPSQQTGFGFKASVGFASASEKVMNGTATLEMAFGSSGGLQSIHFDGYAQFVQTLPADFMDKVVRNMDKLSGSNAVQKQQYEADRKTLAADAAITAVVSMDVDINNSSLHGVFEGYLNAGPLKGSGANNRAGSIVMHYDPSTWYIHIGRPDNRIGVKFGLGPVAIQTGAYLMVGNDIPASPPPPANVARILGVSLNELDYMRDLNALGNGSGFAFGTDFSLSTGDLSFLIFYAKFNAGLGFDMMLKDYGGARCKGSTEPIGINGWYANGQAYGYFQGDIGLKVKLFFKTRKISILKIAAAVLMQAKLPNPFWMKGHVGGQYSVLGGLVRGNCRFKVTLGETCELENASPLGGLKVITDVTPQNSEKDVDVFAVPQAVFNMAVDKEMEIEDEEGRPKKYRIKLDRFAITQGSSTVAGTLQWSNEKNSVGFISSEILPPYTSLKAAVTVSFEEWVGSSWRPVLDNGQKAVETKEVSFETGGAPESIPLTNIEYAYPVMEQQYYFTEEGNDGYIQLKRGQSYLFDQKTGWKQDLRLLDKNQQVQLVPFVYDASAKQLSWKMPSLSKKAEYSIAIISKPPAGTDINKSVKENYTTADIGSKDNDGGETQIRENKGGSLTNSAGEKQILAFGFATSVHGTMAQKINALNITQVLREPIYLPDVHALQAFISESEPFEATDLTGSPYTASLPLMVGTALLESNNYFEQKILPLIYKNYPYDGLVSFQREAGQTMVPVWSVLPIEYYLQHNDRLPFRYHLPRQYKRDLLSIQTQLAQRSIHTAIPQQYHSIMTSMFPLIQQGNYKIRFEYIMPGNRKGSNTIIQLYNPVQ